MGIAAYEIVGSENEWRIQHDGKAENVYTTKELAFEAAVAAASGPASESRSANRRGPSLSYGYHARR